jgi:hypothetical protein
MDKNYEAEELQVVNLHQLFHPNQWMNFVFELVGLLTRNLVAKLSKAAYDAQTSTKLK